MTKKNIPKEKVFFNGGDYFESLFNDIEKAKERIDIEVYILQSDEVGKHLLEYLKKAMERGVQVRVLVDGVGTPVWQNVFYQDFKKAGIQTHVFHPVFWRFWQFKHVTISLHFLWSVFYFIFRANQRDHRKVCIIDRKIVYIGSANISMDHLPKSQGGGGWRDTIVRLTDIDTEDLEIAFNACWEHVHIKDKIKNIFKGVYLSPIVRLNNTRKRRKVLRKQLMHYMSRCKQRIWITNAYFIPDNVLLKILKDRALAGIDVCIVLPEKSDVFIMPWASSAFYEELLKVGVRIFEYTPSILHAKSLILDDRMLVGSSNLNHRSLLHDLEVDVEIREKETKSQIEAQFLKDLSVSKEVNLNDWYQRDWFKKIMGRLSLYLKYWI